MLSCWICYLLKHVQLIGRDTQIVSVSVFCDKNHKRRLIQLFAFWKASREGSILPCELPEGPRGEEEGPSGPWVLAGHRAGMQRPQTGYLIISLQMWPVRFSFWSVSKMSCLSKFTNIVILDRFISIVTTSLQPVIAAARTLTASCWMKMWYQLWGKIDIQWDLNKCVGSVRRNFPDLDMKNMRHEYNPLMDGHLLWFSPPYLH